MIKTKSQLKQYKITTLIVSLLLILIIIQFSSPINFPIVSSIQETRSEYYSFEFNTTTTEKTTNGPSSVNFIITLINTGNVADTITLFAELIDVTNCAEPDFEEWSYVLDRSIITLEPSHTDSMILKVSTACTCQEGCKATITITGISSGDQEVTTSITIYATRGPNKPPPGDPGLTININYNQYLTSIYLNSTKLFDVELLNTQNSGDYVYARVTRLPENWTASIIPSDFAISPNSIKIIKLRLLIPSGTEPDLYSITVSAQSRESPEIFDKDTIKIPVKPDLIINKVEFSKPEPRAGDRVRVTIGVMNMGLAKAKNVPLVIYDDLNYTSYHILNQQTIASIEPNQTFEIYYNWYPDEGEYYLAIRIDPDLTLDERRNDNNIRIEPVSVGAPAKKESNDFQIYYLIPLIILIILILVIIFFKYSKNDKTKQDSDERAMTPGIDTKSNRTVKPSRGLKYKHPDEGRLHRNKTKRNK